MAASAPFRIQLFRSAVTGPDRASDPMLRGALRVIINGVTVADADEYGLERSALGLLRSVEHDHTREHPVGFPTLLVHDCGFPWIACSAFGTDWTVRHDDGHVAIGDVRHFDSHPVVRDLSFPEATCRMAVADYREPIVSFAETVRGRYFADGDKVIGDDVERAEYDRFWTEFEELLARHRAR